MTKYYPETKSLLKAFPVIKVIEHYHENEFEQMLVDFYEKFLHHYHSLSKSLTLDDIDNMIDTLSYSEYRAELDERHSNSDEQSVFQEYLLEICELEFEKHGKTIDLATALESIKQIELEHCDEVPSKLFKTPNISIAELEDYSIIYFYRVSI